jgi:hypothetical protein
MSDYNQSQTSRHARTLYDDILGHRGIFDESRVLHPAYMVMVNDTEGWWGEPPLSDSVVGEKSTAMFAHNIDLGETLLDYFNQDITKDVISINVKESLEDKKTTFKIKLLNKKWLSDEAYTYSDNVLFSPGRRVTIVMGYQLQRGRGEFSRPIIYNAPITDISVDWGSDGVPIFVIEGEDSLDFVLDRISIPRQVDSKNLLEFLENNEVLLQYFLQGEAAEAREVIGKAYQDGTVHPLPFYPLEFNTADSITFANGFMNPRNKNLYDLFLFLRRAENIDLRNDPRCDILWYDGYITGMPNLIKCHGDSWRSVHSGRAILQLGRHTVYFYKMGALSNVEYAKTTKNNTPGASHIQVDSFDNEGNKYKIHTSNGDDKKPIKANYELRKTFASSYTDFRNGITDLGMTPDSSYQLMRDITTNICNIVNPSSRNNDAPEIVENFLSIFLEEEVYKYQEDALINELKAYTSHLENTMEIEIGALGDPIVRPGHIVTVYGLGRRFSGEYEVKSIDSTINDKGFMQKLTLVTNTQVLEEHLLTKGQLPPDRIWEYWFKGMNLPLD